MMFLNKFSNNSHSIKQLINNMFINRYINNVYHSILFILYFLHLLDIFRKIFFSYEIYCIKQHAIKKC